jgi:hypothetical protein
MTTQRMLADCIKRAKNLSGLHRALIGFEQIGVNKYGWDNENELAAQGIDLCELPTFGGAEPENTLEVWSWDEDSLLVGIGSCQDWDIISREDYGK